MRLSGRSNYTLLIAVPVLYVTSQPVFALLQPGSFRFYQYRDGRILVSWTLKIQDTDLRDIEGQKSLRAIRVSRMRTGNEYAKIHIVYQLLPSRKLLASLRQLGESQLPGDARYNCYKPRSR